MHTYIHTHTLNIVRFAYGQANTSVKTIEGHYTYAAFYNASNHVCAHTHTHTH